MFRKSILTLAGAVAVSMGLTGSAEAMSFGADADSFTTGTDISNAFTGISLSAVGGGFESGASIFAINPSTQPLEPFTTSTGARSFGTDSSTFPHLFRQPGFLEMRVDFISGAASVSLDFVSNNGADTGLLRAFDASNNLLDTYTTVSLTNSQFETMTVNGGGQTIAYVLAGGDSPFSSGGLDNLEWQSSDPIPTPALLPSLIGMGMAAIRKRKQELKA
ncbi:MAG: PTPA-CTERM sorting domain-containing protein [Cyanobacteria bacterium P01_F01_bin.13]